MGFEDSSYPNHVCRLNMSLYGLKRARRGTFMLPLTCYLSDLWKPKWTLHCSSSTVAQISSTCCSVSMTLWPAALRRWHRPHNILYTTSVVHHHRVAVWVLHEASGWAPSPHGDACAAQWSHYATLPTSVHVGDPRACGHGRVQALLHSSWH